ncbi:hypothetical protein B0H10DRAFT_1077599 [Mycena sp. CBHHK59/15]|nr:hypothetical protein B0H10DRAFT_1077599 [Mycena sp. CBHHK59/15]
MTVEVTRSLGWDVTTAMPAPNGSKGYTGVFTAKDQPSRNMVLHATNSVLSKSSLGGTIAVSTFCGAYDPHRAPYKRESGAHHFFTLNLNNFNAPEKSAPKNSLRSARAPPPPPPSTRPYAGGGHFILDSAPGGRNELLTTLYCTGNAQRISPRAGDTVVAELRVRPAGPGAPPPWARFFKERHAALHIARRGLEACMTGTHVHMLVPGVQERRVVLARGQALEIVVAALAAALLGVAHDGLESKRWAWLVQRTERARLALAMGPPQPDGAREGHAPVEGFADEHSDDSQGPPSSMTVFERGGGLFAGKGYTPSLTDHSFADGASIAGSVGSGIELDERIAGEGPTASEPQPHGPTGSGGGTWARKNSVMSERGQPVAPPSAQQHLKAGSWPEKTRQPMAIFTRMEPQVLSVPEPKSPQFVKADSWIDTKGQSVVQEQGGEHLFR